MHQIPPLLPVGSMGHSQNDDLSRRERFEGREGQTVIAAGFFRIGQGIVNPDLHPVALQIPDDIDHLRITQVGLKRERSIR